MSTNVRSPGGATAEAQAALAELLAAVEADPSAFDFFALMRRIDCLRREQPRTGEAQRPRQEAIRLGQAPELDFAPAPLHGLQRRDGTPPRLSVRFFGLLGPMGPMPLHFTEVVRERLRNDGDPTLAHFLDLFHHRLLSLFYRAWAQAQPVVHLDRPAEDRFGAWVGALAGLPAHSGALPAQALAYQSGWLTARSRHPEMLAKVVAQFFGVPARVEEHVGLWLGIDHHDRTRLSFARNRAERAATPPAALGTSANAGSRVWDRQYRFRLHLGPLTHAQLLAFLPGGEAWPRLLHWVRLLAGREMQWELELTLAADEQPRPELGRTPGVSPRLGLTSRLGSSAARPGRALRLRPQTSFLAHRAALARAAAERAHPGAGVHHDA
ncbi:MAG: type VI secretion system baseplate subunit TssG [Betaproteobacteria bacterium]|nr:type VI secretion system baseplate subunit TssG [Betaproteobacteria bacterium]MCL4695602.1 type VI secretion system baseplate subunit TssG [Burkholderiaceae bacterium]